MGFRVLGLGLWGLGFKRAVVVESSRGFVFWSYGTCGLEEACTSVRGPSSGSRVGLQGPIR